MQRHVRHLRYAVATTTCRTTVATLQQMLKEAEASLDNVTRMRNETPLTAASK